MKLSDFDYNLPKELIAQEPVRPRDHSRLLCVRLRRPATANAGHANGEVEIEHRHFYDLPEYLKKGDVLVLNNSKVFPARLIGKRAETGGKVEVFLLTPTPSPSPAHSSRERGDGQVWQCLVGGPRRKVGLTVAFELGLKAEIVADNRDGTWNVKFNKRGKAMTKIVERIGLVPLPPYIKRLKIKNKKSKLNNDRINYQTIYASDDKIGSVAAPTAGFHFTPALLEKIKKMGVQIEYVTLHVGLGTFAPVKTEDIREHKMHFENVEIKAGVIRRIFQAKAEGRRIITVGTTSTRALESLGEFLIFKHEFLNNVKNLNLKNYLKIKNYKIKNFQKWVDIFIYPGYKFKVIDAMITNFHLPKSTLLMLVSALAGRKNIIKAYKEAIKKRYRFYSYGDAMLII